MIPDHLLSIWLCYVWGHRWEESLVHDGFFCQRCGTMA